VTLAKEYRYKYYNLEWLNLKHREQMETATKCINTVKDDYWLKILYNFLRVYICVQVNYLYDAINKPETQSAIQFLV
jgi:hypothetical protein